MIYSLLAFVKKFVLFCRWSICKCLFFKTWKDVSSVLSANPIWRIVVPIRFFCLRRNKASISFHLCEMHLNREMSSIETWSDIIFCPLNEYNATRLSLSGTSLYWDRITRMSWILRIKLYVNLYTMTIYQFSLLQTN